MKKICKGPSEVKLYYTNDGRISTNLWFSLVKSSCKFFQKYGASNWGITHSTHPLFSSPINPCVAINIRDCLVLRDDDNPVVKMIYASRVISLTF